MKTSIATVSISGSLAEKVTAIARAGFDGFEIFENDLVASPLSVPDIKGLAVGHGLTIDLYQPFRDFEGVSPAQLLRNLERAKSKFEVMHQLGVDTILVCSNVASAVEDNDQLFVDQLSQLAELAQQHDVKVAYEALAWGKYVSTYDHSWRLVETVNHKNLGICLDSFHILSRGSNLDLIEAIPGDKIFYLQLADAPILSLDVLSWSRHHRLFPGEGGWDLADFVGRVLKAGYEGPLSLEIFNDVYRQGSPTNTAKDGHRSLTVLQSQLGLLPLPELQEPSQIEFAELSPGEGVAVEAALGALGFTRVGQHSRKPASLWAAGEARVVVNTKLVTPQPELTTIALRYPDRKTATERAGRLQYSVVTRDRVGDEIDFGSVAAPDGIEFQFVDSSAWVGEFGEVPAHSPSGICAIDHIAIREPWQTADESALFFRSALGLKLQAELDLPSEHGLVRSRSANNSQHSVRIAMNVNPVQATSTAANHIAFASADIFKTAQYALAAGLRLMEVPANYYLDLRHRTGLSSDFVEKLAKINALYDADETGSFIHFYTGHLGKLFFEVVQRNDGYNGYGAYNSFVRLAALGSGK